MWTPIETEFPAAKEPSPPTPGVETKDHPRSSGALAGGRETPEVAIFPRSALDVQAVGDRATGRRRGKWERHYFTSTIFRDASSRTVRRR